MSLKAEILFSERDVHPGVIMTLRYLYHLNYVLLLFCHPSCAFFQYVASSVAFDWQNVRTFHKHNF